MIRPGLTSWRGVETVLLCTLGSGLSQGEFRTLRPGFWPPLMVNPHFYSEVTLSQRPAVFSWPEVRYVDKDSVLFLAYEARDGGSSKASSFTFSALLGYS